jgi:hypothetical protein
LDCVHYKKDTWNTWKLTEDKRQQIGTKIQLNNCKFSFVVSYSKPHRGWIIQSKYLEHNHAPNPDPFLFYQHWDKQPGYAAALAAAAIHCSIVSYSDYTSLLKKDNLPEIGKMKFYNLQRKEGKGILTRQEELEYVL